MPKTKKAMSVADFFETIKKPGLYAENESREEREAREFSVQLEEPALEMHQLIEVYKLWLQKGIHGYYHFITGKRLGTDRKSRKHFNQFMNEYTIQVEKDEETNFWELLCGDPEEEQELLTSLTILPCEPAN